MDHEVMSEETEMQENDEQTRKKARKVAVSEEPSEGCHVDLSEHGVALAPEKWKSKWGKRLRTDDRYKRVVRRRLHKSKKAKVDINFYKHDIPLSTKGFKEAAKNDVISSFKSSFKPDASVGIISGISELKDAIEKQDYQPFANWKKPGANADVDKKNLFNIPYIGRLPKTQYFARACVIEGRAGFGNLASIGASALSAGAHAEYGWNNSVGLDASVVRVEGNLGPVQASVGLNFDTHASIGLNGISASFLGIGFSVGAQVAIKLPFFSFSISLF